MRMQGKKVEFILYFPSTSNIQPLPKRQKFSNGKICSNPSHGQGWPAARFYAQSSAQAWLRSFGRAGSPSLLVMFTASETFYLSALEGRDFSCSDSAILRYTFFWFTCIMFFLKNSYLLKPFNNSTTYIYFLNLHHYFCILLSIVSYINL